VKSHGASTQCDGVLRDERSRGDRHSPDSSIAACCPTTEPVATYWPAFGANARTRSPFAMCCDTDPGLSHLKGVSKDDLLDHELMEGRLARGGQSTICADGPPTRTDLWMDSVPG